MQNLSCLFSLIHVTQKLCGIMKKANTELIRKAIDKFDWLRTLSNVNVDNKVSFFTQTLLNIIENFIPHESIICDDRDPSWINKEIKKLMVEKKLAFKLYRCSNKNMFLFEKFKALQNPSHKSIEESKEKCYTKLSSRLDDSLSSPKIYLLKRSYLHASSFS